MKQSKITLTPILMRLVFLCTFSILIAGMTTAQKRPAGGGGNKGGGGGNKAAGMSKPQNVSKPQNISKPDNNKSGGMDRSANNGGDRKNNVSNSGNKTNNIGSNNKKVNVDNSKKNVNVNVDNSKNVRVNNSHNTSVRRTNNYRPYSRPPYAYGGYRYRCYHPYYYHPYRPFMWGPMWHPWGFFIATLATTAILISIADNDMPIVDVHAEYYVMSDAGYHVKMQHALAGPYDDMGTLDNTEFFAQDYYYDSGVFYIKVDGGYQVVAAPVGASIKTLPTGYETVTLSDDKTTNYYYGGAFYEKTSKGYTVVPPTAGTVVKNLPEGGEEVELGDMKYVKVGDTYYQPMQQDGKDVYEIADVEEDK